MKTDLDTAIDLLHTASYGMLATQSRQMPGYPFATALPFAPDERHRPVFLLSGLAEHTKNLEADRRSSFLVASQDQAHVLAGARMTLVGDSERMEASDELVARCLRYQPEAEQYLALGDFAFYRMTVRRVRYIGGFARMGWIEEPDWEESMVLEPAEEQLLLRELAASTPAGMRLLGVDCRGIDIEREGRRDRQRFARPLDSSPKIRDAAKRLLVALP